jgi:hypothetical protein
MPLNEDRQGGFVVPAGESLEQLTVAQFTGGGSTDQAAQVSKDLTRLSVGHVGALPKASDFLYSARKRENQYKFLGNRC